MSIAVFLIVGFSLVFAGAMLIRNVRANGRTRAIATLPFVEPMFPIILITVFGLGVIFIMMAFGVQVGPSS